MSSEASSPSDHPIPFDAPQQGDTVRPGIEGLKALPRITRDQPASHRTIANRDPGSSAPTASQKSPRKIHPVDRGNATVPPSTLDQLLAILAASLPPINLESDTLLSPTEVTELLPARRRGRKAHKSTIFRWMSRGYRGLRLPFVQVGHQRCTSIGALSAFLSALTAISRFEQGESLPAIIATPHEIPTVRASRASDRLFRTEEAIRRRHGI